MKTAASLLLAVLAASLSGCVLATVEQLRGKIPQIDADYVKVSTTVIYGVSGTLVETGVKWTNGIKHVDSSDLHVGSPAGSIDVSLRNVSIPSKTP